MASGFAWKEALALTASLERYSKHPLARAILAAATEAGLPLLETTEVSEAPGQGLRGIVSGAITQEVIDVLAVLNALRAAFPQSDSRPLTAPGRGEHRPGTIYGFNKLC